jgi:hypothetical protein
MATLSAVNPTLIDLAKASDPDGKIAAVIEILNQNNEILDDITYIEGNLTTGHRSTIRTGIPAATWRKLYGGVQPTKGTTAQIQDACGMLEAYAEVDKALADLNGNAAAFRLLEDRAHIEGMGQQLATALFYESEALNPERITGFAPRYNLLSAVNGENIIVGGGAGADNTSIWLVCWSPNTVHGIIPKGSIAGMQVNDKGQVTIENVDGAGGRMEAYRTHYRLDSGLCLRDWRYVVRICNIDKSALTKDASAGADLIDLMVQAIELIPNMNMGRPVFYCSRTIRSFLRRQIANRTINATITMETVAGRRVVAFDGISVRRVDALAADEALVA